MTTRSAHATIQGYFYQFDQTIISILKAASGSSKIVVEGIEDVDLSEPDKELFIQCKYYKGSEYNHSLIKDAISAMLKHFKGRGCPSDGSLRYRLFGHYKAGQTKLPPGYDVTFMKKNFLTSSSKTKEGKTEVIEVFADLGVDDVELGNFKKSLEIDLSAPSYEDQQSEVMSLIRQLFGGATTEDAELFYYPNAINVVQRLAIDPSVANRTISKSDFITRLDRKEAVFSLWLREKFGRDQYTKSVRRQHFKFGTKVPPACRIIVLEFGSEFEQRKALAMMEKIAERLSHKELARTPDADRFCPYVVLRDVGPTDVAELKRALWQRGLIVADGHPFLGAEFDAAFLARRPTKDNLTKIKFLSDVADIEILLAYLKGQRVDVFDFYKTSPISWDGKLWKAVNHNRINSETAYFAGEVI